MSAFIVENKTINVIVSKLANDREGDWLRRKFKDAGYDLTNHEDKDRLGLDMLEMNCIAVGERYAKPKDYITLYNYKYVNECNYSKVSCIKALSCYMYQCSEGNVPEMDLYKLMEQVSQSWAMSIIYNLPEYDKCEMWR